MTTNASSPGTAFKSTPGSFSRMDTSASHPLTPLAFEGPRTLGLIPPPTPVSSELTPYPASGILPAKLAALIERGAPNKQGVSAGPRPLVLDLRPNPDFDPISIVHSININLPTLLMRRYRRGGAVTSFALESFITMPSDKDLYHLIQDDWRQNQDQCGSEVAHDVVVLDQDMKAGNEEFGRSPSPAWTLVHVLERGGGNCGGPIRLWYLDGGFEAFQAWDQAEKFLIRPGSTTEMNIGSDVEMASITTTTTTTTTGHGHAKDETVHPMSMPLSLPSSSSTSSTTLTDAKTAQAIDKAVSMTNASLGGTPRQRGTPVRRESLFSLNTKSLQRPAGLSRAQTIGVSALNIKPIAIPPLPSTLQPLQEGGHGGTVGSGLSHPLPPLCHKGSWLTVPTSNMTAAAPSPAMSLTSNGMELAHSASPDHSATWSAHSGGSNHGDDHSGGASQLQRIGSKKSFSSTSTLLSLNMSSSANHGIQEEDEEGVVSSGGTAGGASSFQTTTSNYGGAEVRRHHSGSSSIQPPPSATFFNANMGGGGFSQDYGQSPSRMFADGIDSYTNNSSSGFYSNNSNMMAAMMMASQQQHLQQQQQQGYVGQYYNYDDEYSEEGAGDEGEQEISCILPNFLYLGPEIATKDQVQELERLGIKRILNMARECEDLLVANRAGMEYYKIGVQDHIEADVSAGLLQAVDVIAASNDAPIYVHCKAGKSRSVTAIIAYLITQLHWSLNKAYNHVLTQRPCMCPNIGFVTELMRMEERTLGTERAGGLARAGSLNSILSLSTAGSQYRGQDGHGHHHHHHHSLQHHHSLSMAGSPTATAAGAMPMKGGLSTKSSMNSLAILSPPSFRDDVQTQMQRPF
ncbi:hypothetical protein EDD11_005583 [Mortierella claussenii]|nr:hypothetical protein EDD11_005583 [Mortierella claussenii]